jgi:hypothetical protein
MNHSQAASIVDGNLINDFVDLQRYPITDLESPDGRHLIERMQSDLAAEGACCLRDFLRPDALEELRSAAHSVAHLAYQGPTEATPYFFNYDITKGEDLPPEHPTRRTTPRRLAQVAGDLIRQDGPLHVLHRNSDLAAFLARALEEPKLYPTADPLQAVNISVMEEGGCQQWHFDRSKCVITLLMQSPDSGGDFDYVPGVRSEANENYEKVAQIMDGADDGVRRVALTAGTLMLFRGRYALHRVTPVVGTRRRLQLILAYSDQPDVHGSAESSRLHYGTRA